MSCPPSVFQYQKWGIFRHEAAMIDQYLRFTPKFQAVVDNSLKQIGMNPTANDCIGMHVRHGTHIYIGL
jgi:hypothetical protein